MFCFLSTRQWVDGTSDWAVSSLTYTVDKAAWEVVVHN